MKGVQFDNAAQRKTYTGLVYEAGVKAIKNRVLRGLPEQFTKLHQDGRIHIHDLEAYGQTYNCLQMDVLRGFPCERFKEHSDFRKINSIFNHYRDLIVKLGNEQSGGIGFPNFDLEIQILFERLSISTSKENLLVLKYSIEDFINWLNTARERCGQTTYYVTLNLGLATEIVGHFVTRSVLEYFRNSPFDIIKPNIVFKVKTEVNLLPEDKNHDLLILAMESTCRKMIPTYLLFDSEPNVNYDPKKIAIMGCRTKIVSNVWGENSTIGRGNIDYVTTNLPRIALDIHKTHGYRDVDENIQCFKGNWTALACIVKQILIDRYQRLLSLDVDDFSCNQMYRLWLEDFIAEKGLETIFRNGTMSIGFIGLSEAVEILTGEKYWSTGRNLEIALEIVRHMRNIVDEYRKNLNMNFTLLASSGEYISGRFPEIDQKHFDHPVLAKGFYTNSFHIEVDSGLNAFEKISFEGPFHILCNGGNISYVEFSSVPLDNSEAVEEIILAGIKAGVNYLGINFPLDACLECKKLGTFDSCPACGSDRISRVRRVSGYLEDLEFFTKGKKAEVANRIPNMTMRSQGDI